MIYPGLSGSAAPDPRGAGQRPQEGHPGTDQAAAGDLHAIRPGSHAGWQAGRLGREESGLDGLIDLSLVPARLRSPACDTATASQSRN